MGDGNNEGFLGDSEPLFDGNRVNSSLRIQYEAHVSVIKSQIGDLESIRRQLGLSQRKICQLLMVDPSAWTRWTRKTLPSAPPHIWRALQWYFIIQQKIPGLTPEYFLGSKEAAKMRESSQVTKMSQELADLRAAHAEEMETLGIKLKILKITLLLCLIIFVGISGFALWVILKTK